MLNATEWTFLTELVRNHLVNTVDPHGVLRMYFDAGFVASLRLGTRSGDNAVAVVTAARDGGMQQANPPLLQLLRALQHVPSLQPLPDITRVGEMLQRVEATVTQQQAEAPDPYQAGLLAGRAVFLDRIELRTAVRRLVEDPDYLVLRVIGEQSTGKSYSYELIAHIADVVPDFTPAYVALEATSTSLDVVRMLGLQLAPDESPPALEPDRAKWRKYAATWLAMRAGARGGVWWFVIDGLNHVGPTSEILDFVQQLALTVLQVRQADIRLVLLGYDGPMPFELRRRHLDETVRLLTEDDVREFLTPLLLRRHPSDPAVGGAVDPDALDEEISETVAEILQFARADSDATTYMRQLSLAVEEVVDELAS